MDYRRRNARGEFMRDRARRRDMRMGRRQSGRDYGYSDRDYSSRYSDSYPLRQEYSSMDRDYAKYNDYGANYNTPYYIRGEMGRVDGNRGYDDMRGRSMYDFASGDDCLPEQELMEWHEHLIRNIPEQYRSLFKRENIESVAKQMGVEYSKFSPLELAVTTTMLATDYQESLSPSDIQRYVALGKEFLLDKDSNLKGGEKLCAYYDEVVNG